MTIQEIIQGENTKGGITFYVAFSESNQHRVIFQSQEELEQGDDISKENPIGLTNLKSLCEVANYVYDGNAQQFGMFSENMKQQAIDVWCGFTSKEDVEYGL